MVRVLAAGLALLAAVPPATAAARETAAAPVTIELTKPDFFGDAGEFPDLKQAFLMAFARRFGVRLVVNAVPHNGALDEIRLRVSSGERTGLALLPSAAEVLRMKSDATILPLDYYLRDNLTWKGLPAAFRETLRFDGQVWGLPPGVSDPDPWARCYRRDWADRLGLPRPETVAQLYAMARAFTVADPDGNGRADTIGLASSGTRNLQDIFQACGARLGAGGEDPIAWDPDEDAWVDAMLAPGMIEALGLVRRFYREGVLDPECFLTTDRTLEEKLWSGRFGGAGCPLAWGLERFLPGLAVRVPDARVDVVVALRGSRTRDLAPLSSGGAVWVLLHYTPNPQAMVNAFVDLFLGDEDACLWGLHGIEGVTFRRDGERVVLARDPATGDRYATPGIGGRLPGWATGRNEAYPEGSAVETAEAARRGALHGALIDGALSAGLLYVTPGRRDVCQSPTYAAVIGDVRALFAGLVVQVATGGLDAAAAVAAYRAELRALGGQRMLEEANARIGRPVPSWCRY